ncbi:hypothetical protein L2E82_48293 [Cichorium intybus]|uniref:Uncharacterized protein n=1 Tax=Cichorium intybus TaxID=13427 RepID=A0ACB8YY36_CICIN|nr:hypothetical protein L2E82_48293 [Cichorium intybus]
MWSWPHRKDLEQNHMFPSYCKKKKNDIFTDTILFQDFDYLHLPSTTPRFQHPPSPNHYIDSVNKASLVSFGSPREIPSYPQPTYCWRILQPKPQIH